MKLWKVFVVVTVIFYFAISCREQSKLNHDLKRELAEIEFRDQAPRKINSKTPIDSIIAIAKKLKIDPEHFRYNYISESIMLDAKNIVEVEKIISKYGYPGKTLVGEPTNQVAFLVIQHSNKIPKYLPIVKLAAEKGEIPFRLYAMMLDRHLMYKGEEQIYGTQGDERDGLALIWPIKDAINVNKLRKEAGFPETVEEYSKVLFGEDFIFKNYTLKEVEEMFAGQIISEY